MEKEETIAAKPTTVEKDGLKGSVKQIKQSRYKAFERFGKVYMGEPEGTDHEKLSFIDSYTKEGAKTEHIKYNVNGGKTIITYNEKELTILEKDYLMGGSYSGKKTTTYNENGDMLLLQSIDRDGKVSFYFQNTYDEKGKLLEEYTNSIHATIANRKTTRNYNDEGHLIELIMTEDDKITNWLKYRVNHKGNPIEQDQLNPDGSVIKTSKYRHLYDKNGDRKPTPPYIPVDKEDVYQAKTENDHHGNWIKKITYFDGKPVSVFIREISYFGEEEKKEFLTQDEFFNLPLNLNNELSNPITTEEWEAWYTAREKKEDIIFTEAEAMWLAERSSNAEFFPNVPFYLLRNKVYPSQLTYNENVDAIALLGELVANMNAVVLSKYMVNHESNVIKYTLTFKDNPGYMVYATQIQEYDAEEFVVPAFIEAYTHDPYHVNISQIVVLMPNENSTKREEWGIEEPLRDYIDKCTLETTPDRPDQPIIYMVEVTAKGEFMLQSHDVKEDFEIEDLDIQYGFGFERFHDDLMERFKNESKGLVLFHGLPGTGKTYYIRHLLKEISEANKKVIYMPPNMVDYLVDPGFMTFLTQTVTRLSAQGEFCVLLIEDAEPLLASRESNTRIQGVTNLLNMTDGLLNDVLKLQIICTFNVELRQLDAALLRPGRLIARKEFKALGEIEANLLGQSLGIKHHFKAPATLSEIYAMLKNKNTLIHDEY
jgi:hypothetical protein